MLTTSKTVTAFEYGKACLRPLKLARVKYIHKLYRIRKNVMSIMNIGVSVLSSQHI
jgi:hypothetical protein